MYTKRPIFNNFGRFFVSKNKKFRVHTNRKKPGDDRASTLFPLRCKGLSQQCGAKIHKLFQILAHGRKQFAQPCQYWLPVPHEQDKNGND